MPIPSIAASTISGWSLNVRGPETLILHHAQTFKFPSIDSTAFKPESDAVVAIEILRCDWIAALLEIPGRRNRSKAHLLHDWDRHHVFRHGLRQSDTGIETIGNDITEPAITDYVEMDLRIFAQEACEYGPQYQADSAFTGIDPNGAGGNGSITLQL